jgi:hypothetical protein
MHTSDKRRAACPRDLIVLEFGCFACFPMGLVPSFLISLFIPSPWNFGFLREYHSIWAALACLSNNYLIKF